MNQQQIAEMTVGMSPVAFEQVSQALGIIEGVTIRSDEVANLFLAEREAFRKWQAASSVYEEMIDGEISSMDFAASVNKSGPLAGIARTSDAYKTAVKAQRVLLAKEHSYETADVRRLEQQYQRASDLYESAKIRLGGLKTVSELQCSVLRVLAA